ncbi:MAG: hypothetical protein SFW66_06880 [Gammaproteobacteria bacterium]|nr:hypothetical protein [Gammaproteobacteria bacterium]
MSDSRHILNFDDEIFTDKEPPWEEGFEHVRWRDVLPMANSNVLISTFEEAMNKVLMERLEQWTTMLQFNENLKCLEELYAIVQLTGTENEKEIPQKLRHLVEQFMDDDTDPSKITVNIGENHKKIIIKKYQRNEALLPEDFNAAFIDLKKLVRENIRDQFFMIKNKHAAAIAEEKGALKHTMSFATEEFSIQSRQSRASSKVAFSRQGKIPKFFSEQKEVQPEMQSRYIITEEIKDAWKFLHKEYQHYKKHHHIKKKGQYADGSSVRDLDKCVYACIQQLKDYIDHPKSISEDEINRFKLNFKRLQKMDGLDKAIAEEMERFHFVLEQWKPEIQQFRP